MEILFGLKKSFLSCFSGPSEKSLRLTSAQAGRVKAFLPRSSPGCPLTPSRLRAPTATFQIL